MWVDGTLKQPLVIKNQIFSSLLCVVQVKTEELIVAFTVVTINIILFYFRRIISMCISVRLLF